VDSADNPESDSDQGTRASEELGAGGNEPFEISRLRFVPRWLKRTITFLGAVVPALILLDWLTEFGYVAAGAEPDPMFVSVIVAAIIGLWLIPGLNTAAGEGFDRLWKRGIVRLPTSDMVPSVERILRRQRATRPFVRCPEFDAAPTVGQSYESFLTRTQCLLDLWVQWMTGLAIAAVAYTSVFLELREIDRGTSYLWFGRLLSDRGSIPLAIVLFELALAFVVGVLLWRVAVLSWSVGQLSRLFDIRVLLGHPDRAGGLKPLGYLCFRLALLIAVPSVLISVWVVVLSGTGFETLNLPRYAAYETNFKVILVLLIGLAYLIAIQPLWRIHVAMIDEASHFRDELDQLGQRSAYRARELVEQSADLDQGQIEEGLKEIAADNKVFDSLGDLPIWPFDRNLTLKLAASQVIPILSILGVPQAMLDLISPLIGG
jgi:hypothetical protein